MFIPFFEQMKSANSWMKFAIAYSQMSVAATEVIMRRTMKMSQGTMTAPEAFGMVMEKATAFSVAAERAAVAAASGAEPVGIATAALRPISAKAQSNARKYRR